MDNILFVDDDPNILESYERQFRKTFHVWTALGAAKGLEILTNQGPFAVLVTDYKMPTIDGNAFLSQVRMHAPETVRMMLTGNADLETAVDAVNQGAIFRFLTKPCPPGVFSGALEAGIEQYRLIRAEKEVLEGTLTGCLQALTDVLALVNPEAFGRSSRIKRSVNLLAKHLGLSEDWHLNIASTLSQVGGVILPEQVVKKVSHGETLSDEEWQIFRQHPCTGSDLLVKIPRMQTVSEIIRYQEKHFDGSGFPRDARRGQDIPMGARLLKVALDFDGLKTAGLSENEILKRLTLQTGRYDPVVLEALKKTLLSESRDAVISVSTEELVPRMVLAKGVTNERGVLVLAEGQELTALMITHLQQMVQSRSIRTPIHVTVPAIPEEIAAPREPGSHNTGPKEP